MVYRFHENVYFEVVNEKPGTPSVERLVKAHATVFAQRNDCCAIAALRSAVQA